MTRCMTPTFALAFLAGLAGAGVVIDIPPGGLPLESFFADNPGTTVNVHSGGGFIVDPGDDGVFDFNGATVNLETGGDVGFFTLDATMQDVSFNIDGGELVRGHFPGLSGTTTVTMTDGLANRGLRLGGNSTATISGGRVGLTGTGAPSITAQGDSVVSMTGGLVDDDAIIEDSAVFTLSGGTMGDHVFVQDDAVFNLAGGTTGRDTRLQGEDAVFNVTGGTTGREFVAETGTVNITAGGLGINSGMVSGGGVADPVVNMTGGAIAADFRAYYGEINIRGGLVGDGFRLGRTTGDGSGVTCNLFVKSATIDGVDVPLVTGATVVVTVRGGAFLSAVLEDDSLIGLDLNEGSVFGEDRVRPGAVLKLTLVGEPCVADIAEPFGVLDLADISAFIAGFTGGDPVADLAAPEGVFDLADITTFIDGFTAGCD